MNNQLNNQRYTPEFKDEAIRQVVEWDIQLQKYHKDLVCRGITDIGLETQCHLAGNTDGGSLITKILKIRYDDFYRWMSSMKISPATAFFFFNSSAGYD